MNADTDKIYVQIPSYKDTQLVRTVYDLLDNAFNAERLEIAICWQHAEEECLPKDIANHPRIRIMDVDHRRSKGANWARRLLQRGWNGEPYSFLIDSHMRFVKDWDRILIEMMVCLKKSGVSKPLLSCLPPAFYDADTYPLERLEYPGKIYPKEYQNNLLTRFCAYSIPHFEWVQSPIPAQFIAMGFLFTEGAFNREILLDPNIYFFGDDITTGLRAYCHGYDLFHPNRIIAWHLYDRKTRTPHWDDHNDWWQMDASSFERIGKILKGEDLDLYSRLGKIRSVADYEKFIGCKLILND